MNENEIMQIIEEIKAKYSSQLSESPFTLTNTGLYMQGGENKPSEKISNFVVSNITIRCNIDNPDEVAQADLDLVNCATGETPKVTLTSEEITSKRWLAKLGFKFQCGNYTAFNKYLEMLLMTAETRQYYTRVGWHRNGYVLPDKGFIGKCDGVVETCSPMEFECNEPSRNDDDERKRAMAALDLCIHCTRNKYISLIIFLTMLLSMMTTLFRRGNSNRVPQYTLLLQGASGAGKTTLVKTLFGYFKKYSYFDLSVGFTIPLMLKELDYYTDTPFLADDLVSQCEPQAIKNVEMITRLCGNQGSAHKTTRGTASANCLAILTAEVIPSVNVSTLNRMIILTLSRDDIDFDKVSEAQKSENKVLLSRAICDIIKYIYDNDPDSVIKDITLSFQANAEDFSAKVKGLPQRWVEAYSWLYAINSFFNKYRETCGLAAVPETEFRAYIESRLKEAAHQLMVDHPDYRFCSAISDNHRKFQNKSDNKPLNTNSWGYCTEKYFFVENEKMDAVLNTADISFADRNNLLKMLMNRGILVPDKNRGYKSRITVGTTYYGYRIHKDLLAAFIGEVNSDIACGSDDMSTDFTEE